jgi:hypothetical protein
VSEEPKVGDIVYASFSPAKCGKVVEVRDSGSKHLPWEVRVKLIKKGNPVTDWSNSCQWNDYQTLLIEHERKAYNMREKLKELEAL